MQHAALAIYALAAVAATATATAAPSSFPGWINVRQFGAKGDGAADDGPAVRAAFAEAGKQGGGTVYFPAGVYRGGLAPNPENAAYRAVALLPSNVRVVGDGEGASVVGFLPGQPQGAFIFLNTHIGSGGDHDISIEDLTLDGFAAEQHPALSQNGMGVLRMRHLTCRHVRFRNVYGTAQSGVGESFHVEFGLSTGALFDGCEVVGDAGTTASGFSADASTDITYIGCEAHGMKVSCGFTHNDCAHVTYVACRAYSNPNGFNSEVSTNISYIGCTSGGLTVARPAYPYPPSTSLGNRGPYGSFILNGDRHVLVQGCTARNNSTGLWVQNASDVRIVGGDFSFNRDFGMHINDPSLATTRLGGHPVMTENGKAALDLPSGRSPAEGPLAAPPVPRSGQDLLSPYPMDVTVYLHGGSVSRVEIDGAELGIVSGAVHLPAGGHLRLSYTHPPRWTWIAD